MGQLCSLAPLWNKMEKITKNGRSGASRIIGLILFISLAVSAVYALIRFIGAPAEIPQDDPYTKVKADYLLILVECLLGLVVTLIPTFISRRFKIILPNTVYVLYFIFLYCAIYLGEVLDFYYRVPFWDTILHAFSGAMLGALGFVLVDILNRDSNVNVSLSPLFVSLFAFCFALAMGALWEIYEFSVDKILGLNMQKHTTEFGIPLSGAAALGDTMKDIIIDAIAAFAVAVIGFFTNRKRRDNKE